MMTQLVESLKKEKDELEHELDEIDSQAQKDRELSAKLIKEL